MNRDTTLIWLILAWLAYFVLHSLLASLRVKGWVANRWPALGMRYRLAFNAIALITALPIALLTLTSAGAPLWTWQGPWQWVSWGLLGIALAGFWWSSRYYDMIGFLGLRPAHPTQEQAFHISPLHRYVRHPWYFLGLLLIWSRDMNPAMLTTALMLTLYLDIGSRLEERKLVTLLGQPYRDYRARVPRLIPLPWRYLTTEQARELTKGS